MKLNIFNKEEIKKFKEEGYIEVQSYNFILK